MLLLGLLSGCQPDPLPDTSPLQSASPEDTALDTAPDTAAPTAEVPTVTGTELLLPEDTGAPQQDTGPVKPTGLRLAKSPTYEAVVPDVAIWNGLCVHEDMLLVTSSQHHQVYLYQYDFELTMLGDSPLPRTMLIKELPQDQMADFAMACYGDRVYIAAADDEADDLYIASYTIDGEPVVPLTVVRESFQFHTNDMHLLADDEGVHLLWGDSGKRRHRETFSHDLESLDYNEIKLPLMSDQLGSTRSVDGGYWLFSGDRTNHEVQLTQLDADWTVKSDPFIIIPQENPSWNWFPSGTVRHEETGYWFVAYNNMVEGAAADDDACIRVAVFDADLTLLDIIQPTKYSGQTRPHLDIHEDTLFLIYDGGRVHIEAYDLIAE